ncbi:MAG TPA: proline dehydrogenase family protein [Kofleriaceae bacterium]|nr:proline dehydrogenase family protein [Kofleriaceae bacterium]
MTVALRRSLLPIALLLVMCGAAGEAPAGKLAVSNKLAASKLARRPLGRKIEQVEVGALRRERPIRVRGAKRPARTGFRRLAAQLTARAGTLATRAATLPAHIWPFNRAARLLAHGEPLTGLSPASAVRTAEANASRGVGTTIGRLASSLRDPWSVRGAERSYRKLIDGIAAARARDPRVDASIAFDPYSFGYEMAGVSQAAAERTAMSGMLRVAKRARDRGVPIEMDMSEVEGMPFSFEVASAIVTQLRMPVRIAIPARYQQSEAALDGWARLARATGIKLGVRLVKGSFVESRAHGAINRRAALLTHYKRMITLAMERADALDIAVATQNEEIFDHAQAESARLGAPYVVHVIRGVNPPVQAKMRAAGVLAREYVSYGIDGASFGLKELFTNWRERRAITAETSTPAADLD